MDLLASAGLMGRFEHLVLHAMWLLVLFALLAKLQGSTILASAARALGIVPHTCAYRTGVPRALLLSIISG